MMRFVRVVALCLSVVILSMGVLVPGRVYGVAQDESGGVIKATNFEKYDVRVLSKVTAKDLDAKFKNVLSGLGSLYIKTGKKYGIDPAFLAGLSIIESGNGDSGLARAPFNNIGGITCGSATNCGFLGDRNWRKFGSVEESLEFKASLLKRSYVDLGLVTMEQIRNKYAPLQDGNATWLSGIASVMKTFGVKGNVGSPSTAGDVTKKKTEEASGATAGAYESPFKNGTLKVSVVGVDDRVGSMSNVQDYAVYGFGKTVGTWLFGIALTLGVLALMIMSFYWMVALLAYSGIGLANDWLMKWTGDRVDMYQEGALVKLGKYSFVGFAIISLVVGGTLPKVTALIYVWLSDFLEYIMLWA